MIKNEESFKIEYDNLGNIKNIEIPIYNIIKDKDDKMVVREKMQAQTIALLEFLGYV